jgi:hypothetical protein
MSVDKEKLINDLVEAVKKAWDSMELVDIHAVNTLLNSIQELDPEDQDPDFHEQYWFYDEFKSATNTEADFYDDEDFENFVLTWGLELDFNRHEFIKNMVTFISK